MTLTEKLDRLPPCVARIWAKKDGRLATSSHLMKLTGWGARKLLWISRRKSWADVSVRDVDAFLSACGLSWSSQSNQRLTLMKALERGGLQTMLHLERRKLSRTTRWQASQLARHIRRLEKILSK